MTEEQYEEEEQEEQDEEEEQEGKGEQEEQEKQEEPVNSMMMVVMHDDDRQIYDNRRNCLNKGENYWCTNHVLVQFRQLLYEVEFLITPTADSLIEAATPCNVEKEMRI